MNGEPDNTSPDRGTVLAEQRTDLALQRTIIAAERTLMAWIRTSISMIGFGFSIYKFFQYLGEEAPFVNRPQAPRNFGLALIALGTISLIVASWQHKIFLKQIGVGEFRYIWSLSVVVAIFVVVIGIFAFMSVLTRSGPF